MSCEIKCETIQSDDNIKFPCHMEYKNNINEKNPQFVNFIVLFFNCSSGIVTKVLSKRCTWPVGYFTGSWSISDFTKCPVGTSTTFTDI